jgi:hypothetical protein
MTTKSKDSKKTKAKLDSEIKKLSVKAGSLPENSKVYLASDVKHFEGPKETPKGAFYRAGDLAKKELVILASKLSRLNKWASEHHNAILGSIVGGVGVYKLGKFITDADK